MLTRLFRSARVVTQVAHCHETNGVFLMVQQFLDTELVISFIGCQKLDVIALEAGKAIDHLQLVMLFKTLLEGATARTPSFGYSAMLRA